MALTKAVKYYCHLVVINPALSLIAEISHWDIGTRDVISKALQHSTVAVARYEEKNGDVLIIKIIQ